MPSAERPGLEDDLDRDLDEIVQYLTLLYLADEMSIVVHPMRRILIALLVAQDALGQLTPYRRYLHDQLVAARARDKGTA